MREIVIAAFDQVELLDITGPAAVFSAASRLLGSRRPGYRVTIAAARPGPLRASCGIAIVADASWSEVQEPDTVLVPGTLAGLEPLVLPELVGWLRSGSEGWRRVASVCAGAHMLAAAGLLDGRRATTHWYTAARLAADHPQVTVDPDPIFIRDGRVWTCAGVTSGMDLALALVADDHGERLAREVARWLVMYLRRPGGQSQFSVPLSTPEPRTDKIRQLQHWINDNPQADLSVPALAARAHLSERHFARVFADETSMTPASYVDATRTEAARRLLEQTDEPLETVARRCGFGSVETLHRAFRRRLGTTPHDYRSRFKL